MPYWLRLVVSRWQTLSLLFLFRNSLDGVVVHFDHLPWCRITSCCIACCGVLSAVGCIPIHLPLVWIGGVAINELKGPTNRGGGQSQSQPQPQSQSAASESGLGPGAEFWQSLAMCKYPHSSLPLPFGVRLSHTIYFVQTIHFVETKTAFSGPMAVVSGFQCLVRSATSNWTPPPLRLFVVALTRYSSTTSHNPYHRPWAQQRRQSSYQPENY